MKRTSLILVVAASAAALLAAPFLGMERIPPGVLWGAADERLSDVFWKLRLPRVIIAILETFQQADGSVRVPDVLVPYMGGQSVLKPLA